MNWLWTASIIQWILIFVLALLLLALMRQAGEFANSIEEGKETDDAEGINPNDGPKTESIQSVKPFSFEPFARFSNYTVPLLRGGTMELGGPQKMPALIVFFTPKSGECKLSPEAIREFLKNSLPAEFAFLLVLAIERSAAGKYVSAAALDSVPIALLEDFPEHLKPEGVFLAVGITSEGIIAARGRPQTAAHLVEMACAAQHMAGMCPDHSRRQHEWGESAPYWAPYQIAGEKPQTRPETASAAPG